MTDNQPPPDPTGALPTEPTLPVFATPQAPDPTPTPASTAPTFDAQQPGMYTPAPVPAPRPASRRRGIVDVVLVVAAVVAVGGVGFALGRVTAPTTNQAAFRTNGQFGGQFPNGGQGNGGQGNGGQGNGGQGNGGQGGNGAQGNGGQGGNGAQGNGGQGGLGQGGFAAGGLGITLSGEVTEVAADHLTLKLANGQTIQIATTGTTTYHTQAAATAADVKTGSTVQVQVTRGGVGSGGTGTGNSPGNGGTPRLGQATSVTVVPK